VLIGAKVSFPRRDEDSPPEDEDAPREPTLFVNEVTRLVDTVKADAKALAIRIPADRTTESDLAKLKEAVLGAPGETPVTLIMSLDTGAEATLSLGKKHRIEVGDAFLSRVERIFGAQVAELL
jgi:DNA polymerase-3 subunit alpha